ncbi:hypothetical protein [Rhodococcus sp. 24CO]|uniref:hypothetical protein n=1 Tax=Rhodococcus sp. 24CO TaxID=3117460 RepID=UPI003D32E45B
MKASISAGVPSRDSPGWGQEDLVEVIVQGDSTRVNNAVDPHAVIRTCCPDAAPSSAISAGSAGVLYGEV